MLMLSSRWHRCWPTDSVVANRSTPHALGGRRFTCRVSLAIIVNTAIASATVLTLIRSRTTLTCRVKYTPGEWSAAVGPPVNYVMRRRSDYVGTATASRIVNIVVLVSDLGLEILVWSWPSNHAYFAAIYCNIASFYCRYNYLVSLFEVNCSKT